MDLEDEMSYEMFYDIKTYLVGSWAASKFLPIMSASQKLSGWTIDEPSRKATQATYLKFIN